MFGRKRQKKEAADYDADVLRSISRRLTGWTVTGSSGVDLPVELSRAASEIERLQALVAERAEPA